MSARSDPIATRVFYALVLAFGSLAGLALLDQWAGTGKVPHARGWLDLLPLATLGVFAAVMGTALAKRADLRAIALAALAWAFGVLILTELPNDTSAFKIGDGPWLRPVYLLATLCAGLYAARGLAGHTIEQRIAVLGVFFASANARLFSRAEVPVCALLFALVLLGLVGAERRLSVKDLARGPGRIVVGIAALFLAWVLLAAILGDHPTFSTSVWTRMLCGALLAWTLAGSLGRDGVRRVFGGMIAALALSLVVLVIGTAEVCGVLGTGWLRVTRIRLFDTHPGLIAPFLAVGVCLASAYVLSAHAEKRTRALLFSAVLALGILIALAMNQARASLLGAVVGVAALTLGVRGWLPRRSLVVGVLIFGGIVGGVGVLVSPLGAGVRSALEAKAQTASALGQRYHFWQMAGNAVKRDPLFGQGVREEFARTDLATPSYLDSSDQWLHAHNLLFSVAEGAGIPAAVLFLLLVLAALELGRRAVLSAKGPGPRAIAAGLFAALIAHLTANVLSMGQALMTIIPLFVWVAIGLFAALLSGDDEPREREDGTPVRAVVASVLLLAFAASPLAGSQLYARGMEALRDGKTEEARDLLKLALTVHPLDQQVHHQVAQAEFALGNRDAAIEHLERACAAAPKRASGHFTRGGILLISGEVDRAVDAFQRATELDPRGRSAGDYFSGWAGALLRRGDVPGARAALLRSLRLGGEHWKLIPKAKLPAREGDPPDAARLGFLVGDPTTSRRTLALDELLEELARDMRAALAEDPPNVTAARRLLGWIVEAYRAENLVAEPLALLEEYAAVVPDRYSSTNTKYAQVLMAAGRDEEADQVSRATLGQRAHIPGEHLLHYFRSRARTAPSPELFADAQELAATLDLLDKDDQWFLRGTRAPLYGFLAELAMRRGDWDDAERYHRLERFDLADARSRRGACLGSLQSTIALGADDAVIARAAGCFAEQASLDLGFVFADDELKGAVQALAGAFAGRAREGLDALRPELSSAGPVGERLLALLGDG